MSEKLTGYELIDEQETARILGVSVFKLRSDRVKGAGLKFVKINRCVRYRMGDIHEYIERNTYQSTAQADSQLGGARLSR